MPQVLLVPIVDFSTTQSLASTCLPKPVSGISGADGRIKGITWEDFNKMIRIANKNAANWNIRYTDRQNSFP